jgi:fido (protein-threonine AMPylation protein)
MEVGRPVPDLRNKHRNRADSYNYFPARTGKEHEDVGGLHAFEADEIGVRFHHRIVQIHPFVNGNGRHGRIAADLLVSGLGQDPFTWGRGLNMSTVELRARYHTALRRAAADPDDIADLAAFARS